jgi:hypothetical protein
MRCPVGELQRLGVVMLRAYRQDNLRADTLETIERINKVLEDAQRDNVSMSLRQVYYKFVKNNWVANDDREYKKLGKALDSGRMNGLIPWDAIVDMNRQLYGTNTQAAPEVLLEGLDSKFHLDLWADQQWRPEVHVEKLGLLNVIGSICSQLRVDYYACKGYDSQTMSWRTGRRMARYISKGQRPIIFHIGDHDPSGLDMTRDIRERIETFAGVEVMVVRLALNMEQVEELGPSNCPPNPAKLTDSRAEGYIEQYGRSSWEVDALEPTYIRNLIETNVSRLRDEGAWSAALAREVAGKEWLRTVQSPTNREINDEDERDY